MKKLILSGASLFLLGIGISQAQITNLHNFPYQSYPMGSVIKSGNVLYGMTKDGVSGYGNIFSVDTDGSNYKDLYDFKDTGTYRFNYSGEYPYGSLVLVGNTLFGTTEEGGYNGEGTVFSIHTDGTHYRDLIDFYDSGSAQFKSGGEYPEGTLIAIGGKLFGMTDEGGWWGYGEIFSLDTAYSIDSARKGFRDLWDFDQNHDSNGAYPYLSKLTPSLSGKVLYGMTNGGGKSDFGSVFSIDTNGKHYKDLYDFKCCDSTGKYPDGSLTLSGNKLFGMTQRGAGYGSGTIFTIDTAGHNYKQLLMFEGMPNGSNPYGDLTISGNTLYGMTRNGGSNSYGIIFNIDTNGTGFKDIFNFDYNVYGEDPEGSLILSGTTLYGMDEYGADFNGGCLFSYGVCNLLTVKHDSTDDNGSGNGTATAMPYYSPSPYTYSWSPGGQTNATATGLSAGTYTVTVTDGLGCMNVSQVTVNSDAGINNISAHAGISVYPNPNTGSFTVALSGGTTDRSTIEVYNTMGQQVYTGALALGSNTVELNSKANGVYLYRIISENGNLLGQGKLEVQK